MGEPVYSNRLTGSPKRYGKFPGKPSCGTPGDRRVKMQKKTTLTLSVVFFLGMAVSPVAALNDNSSFVDTNGEELAWVQPIQSLGPIIYGPYGDGDPWGGGENIQSQGPASYEPYGDGDPWGGGE